MKIIIVSIITKLILISSIVHAKNTLGINELSVEGTGSFSEKPIIDFDEDLLLSKIDYNISLGNIIICPVSDQDVIVCFKNGQPVYQDGQPMQYDTNGFPIPQGNGAVSPVSDYNPVMFVSNAVSAIIRFFVDTPIQQPINQKNTTVTLPLILKKPANKATVTMEKTATGYKILSIDTSK